MKKLISRVWLGVIALACTAAAQAQRTIDVVVAGNQLTGTGGSVAVVLNSTTGEGAVSFTLSFDPTVLQYKGFTNGKDLPSGFTVQRNETQVASGRFAFAVLLESGTTFTTAGAKELVVVKFDVLTQTAATNITFTNTPTTRKVTDADGATLTATFNDKTIAANLPPAAPTITTPPANQTIASGANASFTVAASGNPATFTYQWQRSTDGGTTFTNLSNTAPFSGATTATLTVTGATVSLDGNRFRAVVGNGVTPDATSASALLTVGKAAQTITFGNLAPRTFGDASFALSGSSTSGLVLTYTSSNPAVATIQGNTVNIIGAGSTNITASQGGNLDFGAAADVVQTLVVNKAAATVSLSGTTAAFTGTARTVTVTTTPSGLPVTVTYDGGATAPTNVGTYAVVATVNSPNFQGSASGTLEITKATQLITFPDIGQKSFSDGTFALTATGGASGLPVTYTSSDTSVVTVNGSTLTFLKVGTATITANQAGNANFNAATAVARTITIVPATQTITFTALTPRTFDPANNSFALTATASSGLPVNFASSDPSIAFVAGNTLNVLKAGSVTITASQDGNENFGAATAVTRTLTINKGTAQLSFGGLAAVYDGAAKPVSVTTNPAGLEAGVAVTYKRAGTTDTPSATAPSAAGSYDVAATLTNDNYSGSGTATLVIAKATQTIAFAGTELAGKTFGDGPVTLVATATSGLPVTFSSSDPSVASIVGSVVTILTGGTTTISALQAGDPNFNAATPVTRTLTVNKAAQTITFAALGDKTFTDAPFALTATSTSGLPAAFSVVSGPASIAGNTLTITGAGAITVRAAQVGNINFAAATPVDRTFNVAKANQTIDFPLPISLALDQSPFALVGTATSNLALTFATSNPVPTTGTHAVATLNGNVLALVGTGKIDITASQGGDGNFNAATAVTKTLIVNSQSQTLTFAATELPNKVFGDADFAIRGTSNRGLPITFISDNPGVAVVIQGTTTGNDTTATVKITGAGSAKISATQLGTADTSAAAPIERTLTVAKANQTITFAALANKIYLDAPFTVGATASSSLPPVFSVVSGPATLNAATSTVTLTGAGTVTIRAAQPGDTHYNAAANVDRTFTVSKAEQTITFPTVGTKLRSDAPFTLSATASSNLTAITFSSSNTNVASVAGNTVTIRGLGTTTLTATQAGDANFNSGAATQTLTVNPDSPVISSIPSAAVRGVKGSPLLFGPIGINAGAAPYTFSLAAGSSLPAGLSINAANGNISGTPTATGTFNATIVVNNATLPAPTANAANSRAVTFTIDPAVPAFTNTPVAAAGVVGSAYTGFAAPALVDGNTGVTFSATGLPAGLSINATTGAITGTPSEAGSFTVQLSATNSTGAVTVPVSITVTMPANAPVYSGPTNPSGKVGVAFSFTPNFGAAGAATTTYAPITTGLPPGVTFNNTSGLFSGTPTAAGSYPITVQATRVGITASASLTFVINPPDIAPVVVFPSGASFPNGTNPLVLRAGTAAPAGLQLTATPASPTSTFAATGLPAGLTLSSAGLLSGTTTVVGTVDVKVTATTTGGSPVSGPAATWRISVQPALTAPVISSTAVINGQVSVALTHTLTTSTTTSTPVFALVTTGLPSGISTSLPAGLALTGNTITGTPTSAGTTKVMIVATADGLTGPGQELTFIIAPDANVPVVNSNGSATGTVGQTFSYQITATNGPIISYSLSPRSILPAGLSFNGTTGAIFGVPSAPTTNPVVVDMVATNAAGASTAKTLAITVVAPPSAPVIANSGATIVGRVGVALSTYQVTASESPTAYSATGLPSGVVISGTTGQISGTPSVSGTFTAQVSAGNAAAGFGPSAPLFFTIAASASAPVIGGTAPSAGRVGTSFSYQIVASNSPTSYAFTGTLPAGLALNSSTGLIFGTPTEPGLFSISVTATNDGGTSLPQAFSINIQASQTAPVITSAATATATVGQAFVYDIAATNIAATRPLVPPEALDAVNLPAGLAANPAMGRIEGVPTAVGLVRASLVGTNAAGQGPARDLLIDVLPAPSAPVVTSPSAASGQVGVAFSYQITATGKPDSFEVLNAPAWLTLNTATGAISGVPVEPGPTNVSLVASSGGRASSPAPLAIDVAAASGAPIITSSRAAFGAVGVAFTYQILASGTGTITYSAQGLPAGLAVSSTTGLISGTSSTSGVFSVRVTARNASGASYPVILTLTITPSFQIN